MRIDIHEARDLLVSHGKDVEEILRRAGRSALLEHKRAGNIIASWEDGVILIEAEEILVDDPPGEKQTRHTTA